MALHWLEKGKKKEFNFPETIEEKPSSYNQFKVQPIVHKTPIKKITLAHQLMKSPVKTLPPSTTLKYAEQFLRINKIRHVPIVNPETKMMEGILSDRDILRKWAGIEESFMDWIQTIDKPEMFVSECMTKKVLAVNSDDRIVDIARGMFLEKIGCVPVISRDQKILGIITRSDILRMIMSTAPLDLWL